MEWPGRDYTSPPKGYLYLVFQDEEDVKDLLAKCSQDFNARDSYYYKIASRRSRSKDKVMLALLLRKIHLSCRRFRLSPGSSQTPTTSGAAPHASTLRRPSSWELCTG